jgi:hypothetical protein
MAAPSYTYTLTNGTTADASQVMQNFTDILNGVTDGTKDLSISALTVAGTATLNGNVNLGNASGDDLVITASLASNLVPKTENTYNLGSAAIGFAGIYLGTGDGDTARIVSAALAADRTYTLPDAGGAADFVMTAGTQSVAGLKTFADGVRFDDDTGLGGSTTMAYYKELDHTTTWTWDGTGSPGTSGSTVSKLTRVGRVVTMTLPALTATTGTTSRKLSSNTDLPAWATQSIATGLAIPIEVSDGSTQSGGVIVFESNGNIYIEKLDQVAFTNTTSCGLASGATVTYSV